MLHLHIFLLLFSIFSNFEFRGVKADDSNSSCVADTFLKCKVIKVQVQHTPQCLKIRPKSRIQYCELRSYVYILSGQKFIKNAKKMVNSGEFLKTWSLRSNSVTSQVNFKLDKNWCFKITKNDFHFKLHAKISKNY